LTGVEAVFAGTANSFIIKNDGTLWAAGYNYYGQLGLGNRDNQTVFVPVESLGAGIRAAAPGARHTLVLKNDGTLWAAGDNYFGQLGLQDTVDRSGFVRVESLGSAVSAIAAGNYHSVALKKDGTLWAAGANYRGQLAVGDNADRRGFTRLEDRRFSGVSSVLAGGDITLIRGNDGGLLMAGAYADPPPELSEPLRGDPPAGAAVLSRDEPGGTPGDFAPLRFEPSLFGEIKKAVPGCGALYVLSGDGYLWAAGSNRYGQLGLGYDTEKVETIKKVYP
jgi:alpha-tubulin suppressor-like RCC1 family protein